MSCDDTTNRAWWIALLVLLLIGAIVWGLYLYGEGNAYPIHAPDAEAESRRVVDGEMLSGMRDQSSRRAADLEAQPGAEGSPSGLARGPVTIHALGPTGASLANVMVTLFEDDDGKATARDAQTDGHGRAIFSDVRLDGSARAVLLYASEAGSGSTECASAKITSGSVDLRSRRGLPLAFRFVVAGQPGSRDVHILKRPYFCGLAGALPSEATAVAVEPGPLEEVLAEWKSPPRCAGRTSSRMRFPFPPDVQQAHGMRPLRQEAEVVLVAKSGVRDFHGHARHWPSSRSVACAIRASSSKSMASAGSVCRAFRCGSVYLRKSSRTSRTGALVLEAPTQEMVRPSR